MMSRFLLALLALTVATTSHIVAQPAPAATMRLYTLNCGHLEWKDMGPFSDTGEHAGERGSMAAPCYLIRHGSDWMLWDTGLGDGIAAMPNGEMRYGGRFTVQRTLLSQLAELGLKPNDVRFVALSHLHTDHSGNIGLFPKATFLIATSELAWAHGKPTPTGVDPALIAPLLGDKVSTSDDDRDVFGDGTVQILRAPGHTPGHRILMLRLASAGVVLISGDLYHSRENYEKGLIPAENTSRADTLASFARFARIVKNTHARVVIQHSIADFSAMPAFPKYLF